MNLITANIGQGSLAVIRHNNEALVIDSKIPAADDNTVVFVKQFLAFALKNHNVKGLILTGFDADHAMATGVALILSKYRPDWVLYPKYYKDTDCARDVFDVIEQQVALRRNSITPLRRVSVRVDNVTSRNLNGLSTNFAFFCYNQSKATADYQPKLCRLLKKG